MAAIGQNLGRQTRSLWDQMTSSQKLMVLLAIALGVVAMVLLLSRAGKTEMVPLYTNLSASDAADIVTKLREMRIPYELSDGGTTVKVPFSDVYETRMDLASQGLPKGSTVGFEIFDKTTLGVTEFTQKMNYRRALQGELTRTIMQLREVEDARVHIAIPEPELYTDEKKPPTASVMLKLRSGATLTKGQVQGIVRLVSSSVEGLTPGNVTVLDVDGNILYAASEDSETGVIASLSVSQLEAKRAYEKELQKSVETMLTEVLGPRKVVVRVSAEINFDRREQNSELFQPTPTGLGVIREQTKVHEVRSTASDPASGIPGTGSNVDTLDAVVAQGNSISGAPAGTVAQASNGGERLDVAATAQMTGEPDQGTAQAAANVAAEGVYRTGAGQAETSGEERSEETTRYEISRVVEHTIKAPGEVRRLSVAAIVASPLSDNQLQAITRSIGAAVGIDPGRGDSLIVEAMEFGAPLTPEAEEASTAGAGRIEGPPNVGEVLLANMEYVLAGIIALFLVGLVISVVRQRTFERPVAVPVQAATPLPIASEGAPAAPVAAAQESGQGERQGDAGRLVKELPARPAPAAETAARVISGWMDEDKR
ncbi:MAG: flagellar M-ring protein FliF [Firmicutes bacterium]|jgi:flagellar M-ring protein FliF|nr:flagellar M-ring protein FliF [Bacillota bacterium]MDH7495401.1 flagellar basal-body MS-ring/collar protein FliF [Bacillota bacterium]